MGIGRTFLEGTKYLGLFGFHLGWFEFRLVPVRPERFVDGSCMWRHPK